MSTPNAGWYPDPRNPAATRYWDGAAWTEHTAGPTGPVAPPPPAPISSPLPPAPSGGSSAGVVIAIVAVLVLLAGGALALVLVARSDGGDDSTPTSERPASPTTIDSPSATEPGVSPEPGTSEPEEPTDDGPSSDVVTDCKVEQATMRTAVEAARVAFRASGIVETPDDYLNDPTAFEYFTWTGDTPETYAVQPIGDPPC